MEEDESDCAYSYRPLSDGGNLVRDSRYQTLSFASTQPVGCMPSIRRKLHVLFNKRRSVSYSISNVEREETDRIKRSDGKPVQEGSSVEPLTINYRRTSGPMSNRPRMALPEVVESDLQHPDEWLGRHGPPVNRRNKPGLPVLKYISGMCGQRWFWGPLSQKDASRVLVNRPNGAFLVRDSTDDNHLYTITFKREDTPVSIRINGISRKFSINPNRNPNNWCDDPVQLITDYVSACEACRPIKLLNRQRIEVPLNLLYPVARFGDKVHSLKDLSRFVLRLSLRKDQLDQLPIPAHLKPWIMEDNFWPRPRILDEHDYMGWDTQQNLPWRPADPGIAPLPPQHLAPAPAINAGAAGNYLALHVNRPMLPLPPEPLANDDPLEEGGNYDQPLGAGPGNQG